MNDKIAPQHQDFDSYTLDPNAILMAEYNYAAQTAFQANEDRVRVFGYVMANLGTVIAAIILPLLNTSIKIELFAFVFFVLSIVGLFALFQLSRLRTAWIDSIKTMNRIKDFYIINEKRFKLDQAFRWRTNTIPEGTKVLSLAFLLAITIIVLNVLSLVLGLVIWVKPIDGIQYGLILSSGLLFLIVQIIVWRKLLQSK